MPVVLSRLLELSSVPFLHVYYDYFQCCDIFSANNGASINIVEALRGKLYT